MISTEADVLSDMIEIVERVSRDTSHDNLKVSSEVSQSDKTPSEIVNFRKNMNYVSGSDS